MLVVLIIIIIIIIIIINIFHRKNQEEGVKGKGKAIPLEAWTGPAGSKGLRIPDFKTIGT